MSRLCIDFGGTRIKLGLVENGTVTGDAEIVPSDSASDLEAVRLAAGRLSSAAADQGAAARPEAVGIALPGVVDDGSLVAAHGKYDWMAGLSLTAWAEEAFGAPTAVENDARAALLGETVAGAATGARDAVLVTLGTGIGTAAMMDGELVRGRYGHAGILGGHVTIELDGPSCNCGNVGCAEAIASSWALARDARADAELARALGGTDPGLKALFEHGADPVVAPVLQRFLRAWAAVAVAMCHAYDPEVVILSGGALRAAGTIVPAIRDHLARHLWSSSHRPELVTPPAPEHSVLRGLAALNPSAGSADTSAPRGPAALNPPAQPTGTTAAPARKDHA